MLRRLLACLAAFTLFTLATAAPAQSGRDWSKTITLGDNGAFILGNPAARTKLVEYLSYTCPHCAHFAAEATPSLKADWIRQGTLSLELRNFVRDPFDLTAAILARCGGAAHFLANHEALFANHDAWIKQADIYARAQEGQPKREQAEQVADIADKTGLIALLAKHGVTPAAQRKCLADKAMLSQVLNLTASAWDTKEFSGTPFFILDGKPLADVHDWARLKALLPATGK
ncbi:MAG TPA: thioredoxin domain-containing protein [Sphingobium sp.]|nr:thioredoxin domain-containing protein [Sphingobium sp.]